MIVKYSSFPIGSVYSKSSTIGITKLDFLHSLIFVGQSRARISISTLLYKYRITEPFLEFKHGEIIKKSTITLLDQTEKTFISYNIGMAISDFCLRNLFNCKYTLHASLGFYTVTSFTGGKKYKFDLIGVTHQGDRIALEAKGSLTGYKSVKQARNQVKNSTINGKTPLYKLASIQGFSKKDILKVQIIDPVEMSTTNNDLIIEDSYEINQVYDLLISELKTGEIVTINNHAFYIKSFGNIRIGILKSFENELRFELIENIVQNFEVTTDCKLFSSGLYIEFL